MNHVKSEEKQPIFSFLGSVFFTVRGFCFSYHVAYVAERYRSEQ